MICELAAVQADGVCPDFADLRDPSKKKKEKKRTTTANFYPNFMRSLSRFADVGPSNSNNGLAVHFHIVCSEQ
jgi:hypothetical protein